MRWQRWFAVVMTCVAVEIGLIATAKPFTLLADVVVSIALVALAGVVVLQRTNRASGLLARRPPPGDPVESRMWWPWAFVLATVAGWELVSYLGSPRRDHPTLSYLSDLITVHPLGRVLMFAGWLVLGGYLVTA